MIFNTLVLPPFSFSFSFEVYRKKLPWRRPRTTDMLALKVGGRIGPITAPGLTTTTSKPSSLANSQAAFSASVFDSEYHSYQHNHIESDEENILQSLQERRLINYLLLFTIFFVSPAFLVYNSVSWPIRAWENWCGRRSYDDATDSDFLGGLQDIFCALNCRLQYLILPETWNGEKELEVSGIA